jgi:hypothetical protein
MSYLGTLKPVFGLLGTTGLDSGTTSLIGNYSVEAVSAYIEPAENDYMVINRVIISIEDFGSFDSGGYGNGAALTNGITVNLRDKTEIVETLTAWPITQNGHWAGQCHDLTVHAFGSGNEFMSVRWTFGSAGRPLVLNGSDGHRLEFVMNDDFSGLVAQRFFVQGYYQDRTY